MVPLPADRVAVFEDWLVRRWTVRSRLVRRGALCCSFGLLGLRWSEVEVMQPGDCFVESEGLLVRTRKRGRPRSIDCPGSLLAAALAWRAELRGGVADRLFVRETGRAMVYQDIRRFMASATREVFGRAFSFHCLRHTAAVRLYERTHDVLAVQRFLGHRSLQWTDSYLRSLLRVDTRGPVAFCGGGRDVVKPRLFVGGEESLSEVRVVSAASKSRGKTEASGERVGLVGHCCDEFLLPFKSGVVGVVRARCAVCGWWWEWPVGKQEQAVVVPELSPARCLPDDEAAAAESAARLGSVGPGRVHRSSKGEAEAESGKAGDHFCGQVLVRSWLESEGAWRCTCSVCARFIGFDRSSRALF